MSAVQGKESSLTNVVDLAGFYFPPFSDIARILVYYTSQVGIMFLNFLCRFVLNPPQKVFARACRGQKHASETINAKPTTAATGTTTTATLWPLLYSMHSVCTPVKRGVANKKRRKKRNSACSRCVSKPEEMTTTICSTDVAEYQYDFPIFLFACQLVWNSFN